MNKNHLYQDEEKLLQLFYTEEHANDLLVFEILKQIKDEEFSILFLNSLILGSKSLAFKKEIYKFIRSNYPEKYHLGIRLLTKTRYGRFAIKPLLNILEPAFSKIEILELFYRIIKRTGKGHDVFLLVDNNEHPKRKEVFEEFQKIDSGGVLNIPGLFPDEISSHLENFWTRRGKHLPYTIHINSLKFPVLPKFHFQHQFGYLTYRNDVLHEHATAFPDYIFEFEKLNKITLDLHPNVKIPDDWSWFRELKILAFNKDGPVFQNIDFLDTIINLKFVSNMILGKPNLFLQKKFVEISSSDIPEKIRNKQRIILPSEIISQIGNDLKKSNLTKERQQYFFEKLLIQKLAKFSEEEIEELYTVDFERKVKRYFYRVMKQRFGPRLTEK